MAQLESGKLYIVPNVGMRDYVDENGSDYAFHSTEEYFIWMVDKIATGLDITSEYHIIDGDNNVKHCFFTLPYINEPINNNKLQLYIKASSASSSINNDFLTVNISYVNGDNYYIPTLTDYLPSLTFGDQYVMVKYENYSGWSQAYQGSELRRSYNHSFVIDTRFLEKGGFYTINFFDEVRETSYSGKIEDIAFTPKIFVCDMINVLNKQHYDGFFSLDGWKQFSYIINKTNNELMLNKPSISAIGVGADEKYSLQGFYPQVFVSDYNSTYFSDNPDILTGSMIRLQFGKLRAYKNIYILLSNSLHKLVQCCGKDNVLNNHISWNKDVLKVNNKNFTLSCSCNYSISGVPRYAQWAVAIESAKEKPQPDVKGCLKFSSDEDFYLKQYNNTKCWDGIIEYSVDNGKTWNEWNGEKLFGTKSQSIYLRGINNTQITGDEALRKRWIFTGKTIEGNIEALLNYQSNEYTINEYCYSHLFYGCSLVDVSKLTIKNVADYSCYYMFGDCTSLIKPPKLLATTLANYCYFYMFSNCTSLLEVPELLATTLANHCYSDMFVGCSSLVETHKTLPALTLADGCYHSMYYNCSSIVKTYKNLLPATTLTNDCYRSMFSGCSLLKNLPELPATVLANYCYYYMFYNCTSLEEICKLPATTLKPYCYNNMFRKCSKIKLSTSKTDIYTNNYRIPFDGNGINASYALNVMFYETGGSFTGAPTINTTYYTSNEVV